MPPLEPNDEEKLEKLDQDYTKPFSLPDDVSSSVPVDIPAADDQVDAHELYDEGIDGATEIDQSQHRKNAVTGYNPPPKKKAKE